MAQTKLIVKSYRTLAGVLGPETRFGSGVYLYDSNNTQKDYAMFALVTGLPETAERFCLEFIADRATPYLDSTRTKVITKPAAFVKGLIAELYSEIESGGYVEPGSAYHSFAVALVIGNTLHLGRINSCPVFFMKDRKFRQVFKTPKSRGPESIQVESTIIDEGDHLVLCSEDLIKHLAKLELRNVLLAEEELNLACSKLLMLANRYEEVAVPRLMILNFRKNDEKIATFFTKRNIGVVAALAVFIMMLFMWGDITRTLKQTREGYIEKKQNLIERITRGVQPDAKTYNPELVLDGLAVPYDAAIGDDGILYIVDDREERVIRFDPHTGRKELIGEKIKLNFPTGIDVNGNRIYVADFSRQVNRVYILTTDGAYVGRAPDEISVKISMRNPKAVIAYKDSVYVCDRGNNRILIFDPDGTFQKSIDIPKNKFLEPNGLSLTGSGELFITLKLSGTIAKISGRTISDFTLYREENGETQKITMDKPSGIAAGPQGIYVADTANRRVLETNPMGKIVGTIDQETLKDFETFYPMSVKLDKKRQYLYIIGSNHYSYDVACEGKCQGRIWRIKI